MNTSFDENDGDVQALTKRERRNGRTGLRERGKGFSSSYPRRRRQKNTQKRRDPAMMVMIHVKKRFNTTTLVKIVIARKILTLLTQMFASRASLSSSSTTKHLHQTRVRNARQKIKTTPKNIAPDGNGCAETKGAPMNVGRPLANSMRKKISDALKPSVLEIVDESWQHAGHSGNPSGDASAETHFNVEIVSEMFEGLNQVKRQRKVYQLLEEEFNEKGLHALQMKTKTPEEYELMKK